MNNYILKIGKSLLVLLIVFLIAKGIDMTRIYEQNISPGIIFAVSFAIISLGEFPKKEMID
ncbi:hypothetical protein [Macrococcoides canis]|uniref:hypothetical protein n=1 Tax=Macrococcoides canis TaxID=1855823 RepID=UPI0020B6814E|nr:hypothetical protein [Macrococcus canis]UTH11250.1 hypothetical protein KFV10_10280 [Macrococcus canis]